MKRIALILALLMCLTCVIVACGSDNDATSSNADISSTIAGSSSIFESSVSSDKHPSADFDDSSDINSSSDDNESSNNSESSDTNSDTSSDSSSDTSSDISSDTSSDTNSDISSDISSDTSSDTGSGYDSSDIDSSNTDSSDNSSSDSSLDISNIDGGSVIIPVSKRMNGIWISQFDLQPIFVDGGKQRPKDVYTRLAKTMISNLAASGFNTIFLQVRPNGDSMYESEYFPTSQYVAGSFGGTLSYDAIDLFVTIAKDAGFEIHAWINPYRLCTPAQMEQGGKGKLLEWYNESLGRRIKLGTDGKLYLDPSYPEATQLICDGAREILEKYDFDGIHIDDYFYPTSFDLDDNVEFAASGYSSKSEFRIANTNATVKALYDTVHQFSGKVFGVSPAGNIHTLASKYYIDVYEWCGNLGYIDYILPQLYFGFENSTAPFNTILMAWANAVKYESIDLYIGLAAYKSEAASKGELDTYAGATGKYEWQNNKDILKRQVIAIDNNEVADGFCIYTYSSFFNPISGNANSLTDTERNNLFEYVLK